MTTLTDSKTLPGPYTSTPRVAEDAQGTWHIRGYAESKELLKEETLQNGFGAESILRTGLDPVLYQHGEAHRQQRAAIAKFFSPTTVTQKHIPMIESTADELIAELARAKSIDLKTLTRRMAAVVACAVIGLNPSHGLIKRLDNMLHAPNKPHSKLARLYLSLTSNFTRLSFWWLDVRPAIAERKRHPQEDVISYMLSKDKSNIAILAECIVYAAAGMGTTQEFIPVVLLHALEDPQTRAALTSEDSAVRYEALHEILRLEPVIGTIKRKALSPLTITSAGQTHTIPTGARIDFHVYDVNVDAQSVGPEAECLQPHREMERGTYRSLIAFGSGPHRCAGEHLAIAETDIFIRKLLSLRGLRLESQPGIIRNQTVEGYELDNYRIAVD